MHWLQSLDVFLFHWVNPVLSNPLLDWFMPLCSGNRLFAPVLVLACGLLAWKGGARGRVCLFMLILAIAVGDSVICNSLKHLIHRPRPFLTLPDVHMPPSIGRTDSGSMPSSHAANWFAATMVLLIYYRRSWRFMLPGAVLVSFSRIYNGVHYPSDVLVGAILGAGYAVAVVWLVDALWQQAGQRWFPLWWRRFPSLIDIRDDGPNRAPAPASPNPAQVAQQWINLAYVVIGTQLVVQLCFLASGIIDVAEDEAYQWMWSKHPALSYYSKPPLIAYTHFIGTGLWGDNSFGIHFFPPIIAALIQFSLLRFLVREVSPRAGFWIVALCPAIPLMAIGNILMTVDPLSVLFWTLAMLAGWRAVRDTGTTRDWLWVGLWSGLGFLSKYTALFQWLSWGLFFLLHPPARRHLRRSGPYLALLVTLLCTTPVVLWNYQHHWITVKHVAEGGRLEEAWSVGSLWVNFTRYTLEFVGGETFVLNPFIVLPVLWAVAKLWRQRPRNPLLTFCFCMGAPVVGTYFLLSFHSRVLLNWIAPAVIPFLCVGVIYWDERWQTGDKRCRPWLAAALSIGAVVEVLLHAPRLTEKLAGRELPPQANALRRISGWKETAEAVDAVRQRMLGEGKPVLLIGAHYGITSEMALYLPEARARIRQDPLVYCITANQPDNQYYFWPGYREHHGANAVFAREMGLEMKHVDPLPEMLKAEFTSLKDLGFVDVLHHGRLIRRLQIIECRGMR